MSHVIPRPHGQDQIKTRILPELDRDYYTHHADNYKSYSISDADLSMFYRMADGGLSPLEGPMSEAEFYHVLDTETIERHGKKYAWTIPIAFPVSQADAETYETGEMVLVRNEQQKIVGLLEISDIYKFDKVRYNRSVYGTERTDHPGPRIVNDDPRDYLLGGKIWAFPEVGYMAHRKDMLTPLETRQLFARRGWDRIVAFQTRNALHRAHEYAMVYAMEKLTREGYFTGAVLNPLVGATKSDDVPADVRMETYEVLLESQMLGEGDLDNELWAEKGYTLHDQLLLIGLDVKMFYAGPKEAIMHAIYRQNYGFTDIIIGRKHADAPFDDGTPAWGDFDAHEKFDHLNGDLQIKPVKVGFAAYFEELGCVRLIEDYADKGYKTVSIAGKVLRQKLRNGEEIDERIMRKPVADVLRRFYAEHNATKSTNITWHETGISKHDRERRNNHRGVVIWLTGLSGSGKSTLATALQGVLFDMGCQTYVLDGDNIRHGLNRDLGFSPEDREENIRRIGEVAKLFADAGNIVLTAFISPYRKDRDQVRRILEKGDFIEVFVKADLDVCEARDPKGLYKKAREGVIKEFTGISAPYEEPEAPELVIDTGKLTLEESVQTLLEYLKTQQVLRG
ncbi:MAG: adenylyl-sulfate kinase [Gemmatimonadetes bacterium]|nr:MAG: adenylyl-sulfate kinase [Gemmatimonadota bacterium]